MRASGIVVSLVLAAAVVVGALEFPRALEPERSDAAGVVLNTRVDASAGAVPNDWYSAEPSDPARERGGVIRLAAPATGRMIESRILPVFPHTCYSVSAAIDVGRGLAALVVYTAEITRFLDYRLVPKTNGTADVSFRFDSAGERRITLAVAGRIATHAELGVVSLARLPAAARCGEDHPGKDIGRPLKRRR